MQADHKTRLFLQFYTIEGLPTEEHSYYNPCKCNEFLGLKERHIPPDHPKFVPGNQHIKRLSSDVLQFAATFREPLRKVSHKVLIENTRQGIKARYRNAHNNIIGQRMFLDKRQARLTAFVKFEAVPISKVYEKPARLIQFRSYEYLHDLKSCVLQFGKMVKHNEDVKLPTTQSVRESFTKHCRDPEVISNMEKRWGEFVCPVAICKDHSKFDGRYHTELLEIEHSFWNTVFSSRYLRYLLDFQLDNEGVTKHGLRYKMKGGRASGEYTTSDGNSLINFFMLYGYFKHCGVSKFYIFVNGDDSVIIMDYSEKSKLVHNDWFLNFNMVTEDEAIAMAIEDIIYCQRRLVEIGGVRRFVREPWRVLSRFVVGEYKFKQCAIGLWLAKLFVSWL